MWNDDEIAPNTGFPAHPHANMEIITYVREGAITHQDSLGNKGRTEAGDVQVMSAGSGIRHSEYNLEPSKTRIFQIWIEPTTKGGQPTWGAKPFPKSDRSGKLVTIASGIEGDNDALPIRADARVLAATLKAGESAEYDAEQGAASLSGAGGRQRRSQRRARQRPRRRGDPQRGEADDHRAGGFRTGAGRRGVDAELTELVMPGLDPGIHPASRDSFKRWIAGSSPAMTASRINQHHIQTQRRPIMAKVLVLYYSAYGHIETMANAVAEGAREAGATVDIKRVPELVPEAVAKASYYKLDQAAPIAKIEDLANYDAIIVGTGTRFGRMASQMANFLDQAGGLWAKGALHGKVGGAFTSTATQHGGQETTLFSIITNLLHFGMTIVGLNYGFAGQMKLDEVTGGSPYGATTITGGDGSRQPSENELAGARYQGRVIAETANKLHG